MQLCNCLAISIKTKLKGTFKGNACYLGLQVASILKDPASVISLFPNTEDLYYRVFVPAITDSENFASLMLDDRHTTSFLSPNYESIRK